MRAQGTHQATSPPLLSGTVAHRQIERVTDDDQHDDCHHRRDIQRAEAGNDPAQGRQDRFGNLDQHPHQRVVGVQWEPGI